MAPTISSGMVNLARILSDEITIYSVLSSLSFSLFDRIHDTVRREGHHYTEETFAGGKGTVRDPDLRERGAIGQRVDYSPRKHYGLGNLTHIGQAEGDLQ